MSRFEYKVVPAPTRAERHRGLKGTPERFAQTLSALLNDMAREGWDYLRADTLPCEQRQGLTGRGTRDQNVLIFRRDRIADEVQTAAAPEGRAAPAPSSGPAPGGPAPNLGPAARDLPPRPDRPLAAPDDRDG
ncbi:MAG: DUF4177 domain-containing protein [Rhodobacteraceae bacterium]|nr:DUF4177 domain-containing protein [Paracoccaceae bacterium]